MGATRHGTTPTAGIRHFRNRQREIRRLGMRSRRNWAQLIALLVFATGSTCVLPGRVDADYKWHPGSVADCGDEPRPGSGNGLCAAKYIYIDLKKASDGAAEPIVFKAWFGNTSNCSYITAENIFTATNELRIRVVDPRGRFYHSFGTHWQPRTEHLTFQARINGWHTVVISPASGFWPGSEQFIIVGMGRQKITNYVCRYYISPPFIPPS